MARSAKSREQPVTIHFPMKGLDVAAAYQQQPRLTTPAAQNVRAYDPRTGRQRGAQRGGLQKYLADQVNSSSSIQLIDHVATTETAEGQDIVETFTSTTTWTCPAGVSSVQVECWGGGGGGGAESFSNDAGGGGGGGAYSLKSSVSVTPGTSYTVTVGAGGAGGDGAIAGTGTNGGDSWFSSTGTVLAKGGVGGSTGSGGTGAGGAGGAAASGVGDTKYSGGSGGGSGGGSSAGTAANGNNASGSTGGSAPTGGGAGGSGGVPGQDGSAPGGGGGGAAGVTGEDGGDGAAGQIRLTYTQVARLAVRGITGVVVAGGTIKKFTSEDGIEAVTNGSSALSSTRQVIFGAQLFNSYYFADGYAYKVLDATTDTVSTWTATAGSLPVSGSDRCRLITRWRGRIVMAGLDGDSHNWFMSAYGDALDWDYAPAATLATQAVAGNNSDAGKVGDVINCLIPHSDDVLIFGGDHTIWQMTGDPMAGGVIDLVSDVTGMAWGRPWCKDPYGRVYFFGSRGCVYVMAPGERPERISQRIEERLADVNLNTTIVRMVWDDRMQGCHLILTPLDSDTETTHYFYDQRTQAWWPDVFADTDHNPKCVHAFDGDDPDDRAVLFGSWDGYIRYLDRDADDDDGSAITSSVMFGPILTENLDSVLLKEMLAVLGTDSDEVTWSIHKGDTPEEALNAAASDSGVWSAGRNIVVRPRVAAHAIFVKLSNATANKRWAFEHLSAVIARHGKVRRRAA